MLLSLVFYTLYTYNLVTLNLMLNTMNNIKIEYIFLANILYFLFLRLISVMLDLDFIPMFVLFLINLYYYNNYEYVSNNYTSS